MATIAFVFARGGSKGIPRKNLRLLAGKSLLAHAIEAARAASLVDDVVVSTDDQEIAAVAQGLGTLVIMRPSELATDDSPEWLSWQHAIKLWPDFQQGELTTFVSIPCTAPLRLPEDIDAVIRALEQPETDAVITVTPARHNPYFNMVCEWQAGKGKGTLELFEPPCGDVHRRQDAPEVYDVTTVAYAARPEFVLRAGSIWDGNVRKVVVPKERALDIDDEDDLAQATWRWERAHVRDLMDLRIAEMLMREREKKEVAW